MAFDPGSLTRESRPGRGHRIRRVYAHTGAYGGEQPDERHLTLFEHPRDGVYPDVPPHAPLDAVTVHVDGVGIPSRLRDLID